MKCGFNMVKVCKNLLAKKRVIWYDFYKGDIYFKFIWSYHMKEFWINAKPLTKCVLIISVAIVLIAAMYFGVIDKDIVEHSINVAKK